MNQQDRGKFLEIVIGFAELKGKQLSAPALELYWNAMQAWTIVDFQAAANHLLLNGNDFMPQPHHFEALRKAGRPTAGEAWSRAVGHCSSSAYRSGGTGNPLIDQCARILGGYQAIAMCDVSTLHFLERRFCEHYETIQDSTDTRESVPEIAQSLVSIQLKRAARALTHE